jgi:predicted transcriptional regulator
MGTTLQARLDPESQKRLAALVRQLGWTPSRVVREALRLLALTRLRKRKRKIIGLGKFDSGVSDLASNKKYLEDFGR